MEQANIYINKLDSLAELENQIDKDQLMIFDDMQNAFIVINFDVYKMGIAYYEYGIAPDCRCSDDGTVLFIGFGMNFLCMDVCKRKISVHEKLQSIFYEFLYDSKQIFLCVICELDVYCYSVGKLKWKMGFRDIILNYSIIDDIMIFISCDDGFEYVFFLEDGKIADGC